ncbi:MAG: hypothetical protein P8N51_01920 [Pseudomonadales bacterium]|jgi:hypothetical protein|nr:hypothetical protein [Pseudomonadales bacterium]MDG1443668.1 hypothetical protein [Pseudomonadales bacterium]
MLQPTFASTYGLIIGLLTLSFGSSSHASEAFPGIEKLMTEDQQRETGVSSLSAEQIKALDTWLITYTAKDAPVIAKTSKAVKEEKKKTKDDGIRSRIVGHFSGWGGKTRFKLENGQVWQQRYGAKWKTSLENPEVVIKKTFLGTYTITIVEADKTTGVTQKK